MIRFMAVIWVWIICAGGLSADTIKLAVTTSFHNSGLADHLLPQIKTDTGIDVQLLVVGTGQALRLGRAGDVDAILVHSKADELAFVAKGHAPHRTEIMYNDFVVVGPKSDPADVRNATSVRDAFARIRTHAAPFVSRGDDSGTHKKEGMIWGATETDIDDFGPWYRDVGAGMGAALNAAAGMNAYLLSDRASWLNFRNRSGLALLYSGDPELFNQYAYLPVNAAHHPHVNAEAAAQLEAWLVSERARGLINGYRVSGEQLFTFNAR